MNDNKPARKMMNYLEHSKEQTQKLMESGKATILAIESSCDETAAAVVKDGREVCYSAIYSQIELHKEYGGVVPELASRSHIEKIGGIIDAALENSGEKNNIDAVAVTSGPGLVGALLVGVAYAKAWAYAKKLPLLCVNHIKGHIYANFITNQALEPPFLCLVVSGGHSHIIAVEDYGTLRLIGRTRDDAAGEAFDKGARALGLDYPGGAVLEQLAQSGDSAAFQFKSSFNDAAEHYDFSFSGYKTALINHLHNAAQKGLMINKADLAASYQKAIVQTLSLKMIRAAKAFNYDKIAIAGGVASNNLLREEISIEAKKNGMNFFCPEKVMCTDNAAMIGCAAYYQLMMGEIAGLELNASSARAFSAQ